jgi:hypothetical protein
MYLFYILFVMDHEYFENMHIYNVCNIYFGNMHIANTVTMHMNIQKQSSNSIHQTKGTRRIFPAKVS